MFVAEECGEGNWRMIRATLAEKEVSALKEQLAVANQNQSDTKMATVTQGAEEIMSRSNIELELSAKDKEEKDFFWHDAIPSERCELRVGGGCPLFELYNEGDIKLKDTLQCPSDYEKEWEQLKLARHTWPAERTLFQTLLSSFRQRIDIIYTHYSLGNN